jgi:hypothetical protein
MRLRIVLFVVLSGTPLLGLACSSSASPKSVPIPSSTRRTFKVCAPKSSLTRVDLISLARRYNVMEGGEPSIVDILKLNEKCRPAPDAEQLDFTRPDCASVDVAQCKTGIVLVPIR